MAKVIIGNHTAVFAARSEPDRIRRFYCDILGCKVRVKTEGSSGRRINVRLRVRRLKRVAPIQRPSQHPNHGNEAKKLAGTNFIVSGRFKAHAVRDGNLITGQQQYSGTVVARLVIEALGI